MYRATCDWAQLPASASGILHCNTSMCLLFPEQTSLRVAIANIQDLSHSDEGRGRLTGVVMWLAPSQTAQRVWLRKRKPTMEWRIVPGRKKLDLNERDVHVTLALVRP